MSGRVLVIGLYFSTIAGILCAQHAVDPANRYYRLICLVNLIGSGKNNDPIRPEYTPSGVAAPAQVAHAQTPGGDPAPATASSTPGILSWSMQMTDDKKMAIIHLVAVDRHAFDTILGDKVKRQDIRVFEIGKDSKDDIEKEMKKYKKDFDLDSLKVVAR